MELLHLSYGFEVRALADEKRSVDVIASTAAIDGYGEIVAQDWDLKRYLANPVVLYGHSSWDMPIGHASNVRVEDGKLLATLNFVDEKASPTAERVWQGIKQGSLRAVSVGFRTKNKPQSVDVAGKPTLVLSGNELIEISVVAIPANPEAIALAAKSLDRLLAMAAQGNESERAEQPARTDTTQETDMNLKALLKILGLADTASELEVTKSVESLRDNLASIMALTGKSTASEAIGVMQAWNSLLPITGKGSVSEAVGVIQAWKVSAEKAAEVNAKLLELQKQTEETTRKGLIEQCRKDGKLAPALTDWALTCPLESLKAFAEAAPAIPQFKEAPKEPVHKTQKLTFRDKAWDQLSPNEKHDLYEENNDLYVAMRDQAKSDS